MTLPEKHVEALEILDNKLQDNLNWAITGSTNLALQGLEFEPDDIDVQTDKKSFYRINEILEEYALDEPHYKESENIKSYFSRYKIGGTEVELMGEGQKKSADGNWEDPVDPADHVEHIEINDMELPVLSLEYEADSYEKLERPEKAEKIREHL